MKFKVGDRVMFGGRVVRIVNVDDSSIPYRVVGDCDFVGWARESELTPIAPEPAPRYIVAAELPTTVTMWHETFESADAEARRLYAMTGKVFRVLKVAAEYNPGEPVVTMFK